MFLTIDPLLQPHTSGNLIYIHTTGGDIYVIFTAVKSAIKQVGKHFNILKQEVKSTGYFSR